MLLKKRVCVIGSTNIDMTMHLDRLPRIGETITNGDVYQSFGGKGANQAVGAAKAGGDVVFITSLGDDNFNSLLIDNFRRNNINTDYIHTEIGSYTGTALIITDKQGNNYIGVASGANDYLTPQVIKESISVIENSDIILLQCEIPLDTNKYIIDLCNKFGKKVVLNLAPAINLDDSYLSKLHLLVVNETEAEFLSGGKTVSNDDIKETAEILISKGPENVIITLGARGSYVRTNKKSFFVDSYPVNAVDTTGAGDVFCGSLAVALTEGKNYEDAVIFATAAAALCVTRLGAQLSAPFRHEIDSFLKSN